MALPDQIDPTLARLIESHPALFHGRAPRVASFVPVGWYDLIERLCMSIENLLGPQRWSCFEVEQIKEKFGTLRFYYQIDEVGDLIVDEHVPDGPQRLLRPDDRVLRMRQRVSELVTQAENESAATCKNCGSPGELHDLGAGSWCCANRIERKRLAVAASLLTEAAA